MAAKRQFSPNFRGAVVDSSTPKTKMIPGFCDDLTNSNETLDPLSNGEVLEGAMSDACRTFSTLITDFTEVLRERVSTDCGQVKDLEDILMQARSLEAHLREKKDRLKRSLASITEKLQG